MIKKIKLFFFLVFVLNCSFAKDYNCMYGDDVSNYKTASLNPAEMQGFKGSTDSGEVQFLCFGDEVNRVIKLVCTISSNSGAGTVVMTSDGSRDLTLTFLSPSNNQKSFVACGLKSQLKFNQLVGSLR